MSSGRVEDQIPQFEQYPENNRRVKVLEAIDPAGTARDFWKAMDAAIANEKAAETCRIMLAIFFRCVPIARSAKSQHSKGSECVARRH